MYVIIQQPFSDVHLQPLTKLVMLVNEILQKWLYLNRKIRSNIKPVPFDNNNNKSCVRMINE